MKRKMIIILIFSMIIQIFNPLGELVFAMENINDEEINSSNSVNELVENNLNFNDDKLNFRQNETSENENITNDENLDSEVVVNGESDEELSGEKVETSENNLPLTVTTDVATEVKNLGNIFGSVILKINGTEINPETEVKINNTDKITAEYTWILPDDITINNGDYAEINLPVALTEKSSELKDLKFTDEDGNVITIGTYEVIGSKLRVVFNDSIDGYTDRHGNFGISFDINEKVFEENSRQIVVFETKQEKTYYITLKPTGDNLATIKKNGEFDSKTNPKKINWVIDINTSLDELKNVTIKDEIETSLKLNGDIEIYNLTVSSSGVIKEGEKYKTFSSFPIDLSDINTAYRIKYSTDIVDFNAQNFNNTATLYENDIEKSSDSTSIDMVKIEKLIEKNGTLQEDGTIKWNIFINKSLDKLNNTKILEELPKGLTLKNNSIKIYNLKYVGETFERGELLDKEYTSFPIDLGNINSAFEIEFVTNVDYYEVFKDKDKDSFTFTNKALLNADDVNQSSDASVEIKKMFYYQKVEKKQLPMMMNLLLWSGL